LRLWSQSPQGGEGVRTPVQVQPGGTITVNVGVNTPSIEIDNPITGATYKVDVAPGKDTQVTIPNVPGGTFLYIRIGHGLRARYILVEVVTPSP
jgi:hypothetical protein